MGFIHELKKKALEKQKRIAERVRDKREKAIREQNELDKLKVGVNQAKRLRLSKPEQVALEVRMRRQKIKTERRREQFKVAEIKATKAIKVIGKMSSSILDDFKRTMQKPKPKPKKRKKRKTKKLSFVYN